jgi:hypothetical protein
VAGHLVLERGRDSPKGYRGYLFGGPLWLSRPSTLPLWAATIHEACLGVCGFVRFAFYNFSKRAFSPVMREPLWLSSTVAPEPLQWYLLGTRKGWSLLVGRSSLLVAVLFRGGALAHPRV